MVRIAVYANMGIRLARREMEAQCLLRKRIAREYNKYYIIEPYLLFEMSTSIQFMVRFRCVVVIFLTSMNP